jgi:hypothetical protein
MSVWDHFVKLSLAVATGDHAKALEVLHEQPEEPEVPPSKEGDPPCGKADGELRCCGHAADGHCVMGSVAAK